VQCLPAAAIVLIIGLSLGCSSPVAPTPSAPSADRVAATPTLTTIVPNVGSTTGDTPIIITGTGFEGGATATIGGAPVPVRFDSRYKDRIYVTTIPHGVGPVDVLVTNIRGQSAGLVAGYTYAAPETFDFNGTWSGFPTDGSDLLLEFTIQNNLLVRALCDTSVVAFSPPVPVTMGAFSASRDGTTMTGKIVSSSQAVGAIALAPCNAPHWEATRKP